MKDWIVVATLLISLFGSIAVSLISMQAVFASSVKETSALCAYDNAMTELNRRNYKRSLKLGFVK